MDAIDGAGSFWHTPQDPNPQDPNPIINQLLLDCDARLSAKIEVFCKTSAPEIALHHIASGNIYPWDSHDCLYYREAFEPKVVVFDLPGGFSGNKELLNPETGVRFPYNARALMNNSRLLVVDKSTAPPTQPFVRFNRRRYVLMTDVRVDYRGFPPMTAFKGRGYLGRDDRPRLVSR